jgi:hypothetical protein
MPRPVGLPKTGGRKKGSVNHLNISARLRVEREADPVGKLMAAAQTGKIKLGDREVELDQDQWLGVVRELRKISTPDSRSSAVTLPLPAIGSPEDLLKGQAKIIAEMSAGKITVDEAQGMAGVLESHRKSIESVIMDEKIAALEKQLAEILERGKAPPHAGYKR